MVDILSKEDRSKRMSLIRSKWTKPELLLHNFLKGSKVKHQMHPCIEGSPDVILYEKPIAIFVHGCFWHKCSTCYKEPSNNKEFWKNKASKNINRDRANKRKLQKSGWVVHTIWEHEIPRRKPEDALKLIVKRYK